jgi:hypothetical protein
MNALKVFAPFSLGIVVLIVWYLCQKHINPQPLHVKLSLASVFTVIFVLLVALVPDSWIWARPTEDQDADAAIILGFGYEMEGNNLRAGEANQYLWDWFIQNKPFQIRVVLVQEGVWVAASEESLRKHNIVLNRIHKHDPNNYVSTYDAAFCAIEKLQIMGINNAILLSHDLQLQRAAWDFEKLGHTICLECKFVIPEIRNVPFPARSAQWQTRLKPVYKVIELLINRPRDFITRVPTKCKAPLLLD